MQAAVDPLMVKGSVKNKTAFEVIKLIAAAKEGAEKVRWAAGSLRKIDQFALEGTYIPHQSRL